MGGFKVVRGEVESKVRRRPFSFCSSQAPINTSVIHAPVPLCPLDQERPWIGTKDRPGGDARRVNSAARRWCEAVHISADQKGIRKRT
jgi:hypothetical protein